MHSSRITLPFPLRITFMNQVTIYFDKRIRNMHQNTFGRIGGRQKRVLQPSKFDAIFECASGRIKSPPAAIRDGNVIFVYDFSEVTY